MRESRLSSSSSSGPCARQRFALDRFSILPVSWWLLGDRVIGSIAVLSRGALDELLDRIIHRELKPLHPCIIFLGSCLVLFVSFGAYDHLDDKLEFIENGVHMLPLLRFRLELLPVLFEEGFSPFSFGPFLILFLLLFLSRLC